MKITPMLWRHHAAADGSFAIKIRVSHKGKERYYPVGERAMPGQWNQKKGIVNEGHVFSESINLKIINKCAEINLNFIKNKKAELSDNKDVYARFEARIAASETKHSSYHVKKQRTVLNKMREFRAELRAKDFTYSFLKEFEGWLRTQKKSNDAPYHSNYIRDIFTRIRTVASDMAKDGSLDYHKNPFHNFEKIKKVKTARPRITIDGIRKMASVELKGTGAKLVRDMYLLSFHCFGIRFGDVCRIKTSMIQNGRLVYTMHKTGLQRSIMLNEFALEIISRHTRKGKKFLFDTGVNWKDEDRSINARNSFYNKKLKYICRKIEVNEITFHSSRHSMADLLKKMGFDIHRIKDALGHSDVNITEEYMKPFYQEETDDMTIRVSDEMKKMFGD